MPKLRTDWSIQIKEWGYGKFHGVLSTGYPRSRARRQGRPLITRAIGEVLSGTHIYLGVGGLFSRAGTCMRGLVSV